MIVLAAAMMMAAPAAAVPSPPGKERRDYGMCLSRFVHDKLTGDKMDAAAFRTAAHTACGTEEAAFRTSWVNYDVAMHTKRADAEENAASQIEDYLQNMTDSYVDDITPAKPKGADTASPVKPASETTPPKP